MSNVIADHARTGSVVVAFLFLASAWIVLSRKNADVRRIKRRHHE